MRAEHLKNRVSDIVEKATALKNAYTDDKNAPVNYACVFSQSDEEYEELLAAAQEIGDVIKETPTGLLFHISALKTVSGILQLLKIRIPDASRPELGDADFTISNFSEFEKTYVSQPGFRIVEKPAFYMIELADPAFNVRAYFSNYPLDKQLGIE